MSGRGSGEQCASVGVPDQLPLLDAEQHALLARWARGEARTRSRTTLLKQAQGAGVSIERAEQLCDRLLNEGWISRRVKLPASSRMWDAITWRDLPRLQRLLGIASAGERGQARQQRIAGALAWLDGWCATSVDPDLLDELSTGRASLEQDRLLRPESLDIRLALIKGIATWHDHGQQGLRRNFALHALGSTKALRAADWRWLESIFDLERLGIARFAEVAWLAGDIALSWQRRTIEAAPLHCLGLPLEDVQRVDAMRAPQRWWLIENRASFEQQARQVPPGVALLWMPGRPSRAWMATLSHLLAMAPAPAWISADADPAGVDIACAVGARWEQAGLAWEPHLMGLPQWQATSQQWPLNDHDRRLLVTLLARPGLAPSLRALCEAMQREGRKAEQEGWL
ncbi:DUF2399 domain-containing protein [Herbaspirillum sp. YR522]|uniref:DUF2399 domain-containing protein n=1 Tax=Herbaspirillum sp. YR522 TaxID=1144342 RepID=UPI00026F773C|nr:DUF2399 domain-containing protein [Herbaspirillum sp. YR522]EJM96389.1 hypothetical protein PMI40_04621 [Herbaspirillum sp. YR522]